ncbi:MAG TPA: YncE family protein [Xanthobacteraceae bacterium]|nr:YncE family protein [Xanthobacteraceae bacterium]
MQGCLPGVRTLALTLVVLPFLTVHAAAQLAVSANDNKSANSEGRTIVVENAPPDTVTIINLSVFPPRIVGEVKAPASVVGPPSSVAIAPDESFALVTSGFKIDPANPKNAIPDDKLSVIDLKSSPPAVIGTLQAGMGASGVSINRAGTLALVANRSEGTVSVFTISGKTLAPAGKVQLGDTKSGPSHAAFTPNGRMALVTRDGDHRISVLSVDGNKVEDTKRYMVAGIRPYSISVSPKGDVAVLVNQGGNQGDVDILSVVDLKQNPPRIVDHITVGQVPEGATMSPDGSYVAITIQNGSARARGQQGYNDHGLVKIFRIHGTKLTFAAAAKVGGWGQGIVWSKNGKVLLAQSGLNKSLDVLTFNGSQLKTVGQIKVNGVPAGIRTVEH